MSEELCGFNEAWIGKCKNPKPCEKHKDKVCESCGKPATQSCESTGQFVCGAPLCDDCEHTIFPEGHNGGVGFNAMELPEGLEKRHIPRSKQKYPVWYVREYIAGQFVEYMTRRAKEEGVEMTLTREEFDEFLKTGANPIFGVHWDVHEGIVSDEQEPIPGFCDAFVLEQKAQLN
jgi:hypothetical protein